MSNSTALFSCPKIILKKRSDGNVFLPIFAVIPPVDTSVSWKEGHTKNARAFEDIVLGLKISPKYFTLREQ